MSKYDIICILLAFAFNLLDFITGFVNAWRMKKISSTKMREGLFHKLGFWLTYVLAILFNIANKELNFQIPLNLIYVVCVYVIITEIISIVENLKKINPDIKGIENTDNWSDLIKELGGKLK